MSEGPKTPTSENGWLERLDRLRDAGDLLFEAADALMRSKSTSEELRRAKDLRAALELYRGAR